MVYDIKKAVLLGAALFFSSLSHSMDKVDLLPPAIYTHDSFTPFCFDGDYQDTVATYLDYSPQPSTLEQYHSHLTHVSQKLFKLPPLFPEIDDFFHLQEVASNSWLDAAFLETRYQETDTKAKKIHSVTKEKDKVFHYASVKENKGIIADIYDLITKTLPSKATSQDWENIAIEAKLLWDASDTKTYSGFYNFLRKEVGFITKKDKKEGINTLSKAARRVYDKEREIKNSENKKRKNTVHQENSKKQKRSQF